MNITLTNGVTLRDSTTSATACRHPEHNPPPCVSNAPGGRSSWKCPECGYSFTFAVSGGTLGWVTIGDGNWTQRA